MLVDCGFMGEDRVFFRSMNDTHDVDIAEFGSAFPPVGMRHTVMPPYFATSLDFPALGNSPVEESIKAGDPFSRLRGFDVLKEGRKSADHFLLVKNFSDIKKSP